jgi:hypothetical protein
VLFSYSLSEHHPSNAFGLGIGKSTSEHHPNTSIDARCCCCLLFHAMTRAARGSSHLVWDAQTSVWALATFRTFSVATIELGSSE